MEGREHTVRVSPTQGVPYINGIDGVAGMQYLNTGYGREGREQSTGQPEQIEKMVFRINKKRVVVAVKDKQRLEAGEEMRVAYGWTKAVWAEIAARGACNSGGRRGWVEGDERVVAYRDRIGTAYQVEIGEEGEHAEKDDRAVLLSAQDLWRETRLGEPTAGGIWDQVHARRQQRGVGLDPVCDDNTDPGAGRDDGGEEAGGVVGDHSEGLDWMDERWVVGQTVEEVNELWETRRCAGWWRGETDGAGTVGEDGPPPPTQPPSPPPPLPPPPTQPPPPPPPPPPPGDDGGTQAGEGDEGEGTEGRRRPVGSGGGLTGKRQRGHVGGAAQGAAAQLVQCALGEVRVGKGIGKGQVEVRLVEVVACAPAQAG